MTYGNEHYQMLFGKSRQEHLRWLNGTNCRELKDGSSAVPEYNWDVRGSRFTGCYLVVSPDGSAIRREVSVEEFC